MNKQIKRMDLLWSQCIKARAGNVSELSEGADTLEAHHIHGKKNYHLRYALLSGICLTGVEHNFHAHGHENHGRTRHHPYVGRSLYKKFRDDVKSLRGNDIYERLQELKDDRTEVDLDEVEIFLKAELKKYK